MGCSVTCAANKLIDVVPWVYKVTITNKSPHINVNILSSIKYIIGVVLLVCVLDTLKKRKKKVIKLKNSAIKTNTTMFGVLENKLVKIQHINSIVVDSYFINQKK